MGGPTQRSSSSSIDRSRPPSGEVQAQQEKAAIAALRASALASDAGTLMVSSTERSVQGGVETEQGCLALLT